MGMGNLLVATQVINTRKFNLNYWELSLELNIAELEPGSN